MIKGSLKIHIPSGHGRDISAGLMAEILRQAEINKKDWDSA